MSVRYCRPSVSQSVIQSVNLSFLDSLCANLCWLILLGIVRWGTQIQRIIDDGDLLLQQTRTQDITSPITVLLEGEYPKYGEKNKQKRKRVPKSYAKRLVGETTAFSSYVWNSLFGRSCWMWQDGPRCALGSKVGLPFHQVVHTRKHDRICGKRKMPNH